MKHLLGIPIAFIVLMVSCKKDKPESAPIVTTTIATNITANTAQIGGVITSNGGTAISKSGVCFALHSVPTLSDSFTTDGPGSGSFTSSLNDLMANKTYYIRAYAINGIGTGYGNEINFMTAKGLPNVTTTTISNNMALMAQSGGNVTNDGGAAITARGVCWSISAHPTIANFKTSDGPGTGSFADTLTNLTLATYYVRAYATNSFGTAYGNELNFIVSTSGTVSDIDGNVYGTITIGTQVWMTSNLKVTRYQNGDLIVNASAANYDWSSTANSAIGAYTFPNDDTSNNTVYGKYYNPAVVNDTRNACPAGWRIPSLGDMETLEFTEGESASDTSNLNSANAGGFGGTIGGNLLVGGSSGLNLQEAGFMNMGTPGQSATYYPVGDGNYGSYWTTNTLGPWGPIGYAGNYVLIFNFAGPAQIYTFNDPTIAGSIRCIKN